MRLIPFLHDSTLISLNQTHLTHPSLEEKPIEIRNTHKASLHNVRNINLTIIYIINQKATNFIFPKSINQNPNQKIKCISSIC